MGEIWGHVPSFDEAVIALMSFFGVSSSIIGLVALAFAVQSWIDGLSMAASAARTGQRAVVSTATTLLLLGPVRILLAFLVTAATLTAQALTLGLCYVGGNYAAMAFDEERGRYIVSVLGSDNPAEWLHFDQVLPLLRWDWVSGGYVGLAGVLLVASYVVAGRAEDEAQGTSLFRIGAGVALPASFLLILAAPASIVAVVVLAVVAVLVLVVSGADGVSDMWSRISPDLLPILAGTAVCALYFFACQLAVHGSVQALRSWRPMTAQSTRSPSPSPKPLW